MATGDPHPQKNLQKFTGVPGLKWLIRKPKMTNKYKKKKKNQSSEADTYLNYKRQCSISK